MFSSPLRVHYAEKSAKNQIERRASCRPIKRSPENFADVVKNWERGGINFDEALRQTGLKQATFYNRLREMRGGRK